MDNSNQKNNEVGINADKKDKCLNNNMDKFNK